MAYHRGRQSEAHEYNARGVCIHCEMYRANVEALSHVCKAERESQIDGERRARATAAFPGGCKCVDSGAAKVYEMGFCDWCKKYYEVLSGQ